MQENLRAWRVQTDLSTFLWILTPWAELLVGMGCAEITRYALWWGFQVWWGWKDPEEGELPWKHSHRTTFWRLAKFDQYAQRWNEGKREV